MTRPPITYFEVRHVIASRVRMMHPKIGMYPEERPDRRFFLYASTPLNNYRGCWDCRTNEWIERPYA